MHSLLAALLAAAAAATPTQMPAAESHPAPIRSVEAVLACGRAGSLVVNFGVGGASRGTLRWSAEGASGRSLGYSHTGAAPLSVRLDVPSFDCAQAPLSGEVEREVDVPGEARSVERWQVVPQQLWYTPAKVFGGSGVLAVQSLSSTCGEPMKLEGRLGNGLVAGPRRVMLREEGDSIVESNVDVEIPQGDSVAFTITSAVKSDCSKRPPRVTVKVLSGLLTHERWEAPAPSRVALVGKRG